MNTHSDKRKIAAVKKGRKNEVWRTAYMKERLIIEDAIEEERENTERERRNAMLERQNAERERIRAQKAEARVAELEALLAAK